MKFVALIVILGLSAIVLGLERPNKSNLKTNIYVDYDVIQYSSSATNNLNKFQVTGNYVSTGNPYSGFVASFSPNYFSFYPATTKGCTELIQTSTSSWGTYKCDYATNGAFFTWDMPETGSLCIGNLISNGQTWQTPTDGSGNNRANFGVTADGKVITGFINTDVINSNNFTQLITGWGWLVRNGKNYVNSSQDLTYQPGGFTLEKAPRTAVGVFKNGTMLLLEVDGEEDILYGPDLFEMGELLESLGVESAINIDGGGSSVSVYQGQVIDLPTCKDTPEICERAVASVTCVNSN